MNGTISAQRIVAGSPARRPHLIHVFSTFAVGGQQTRFISLANAMVGKFRHTIVAMDSDLAAGAGLNKDADCSYASIPVVKTSAISFANVRAARRLLRTLQPDLLLTYNWGAIEWTLANWPLAFCRHIHVEDGFGPGESPQFQNRRRVLTRRVLLGHVAMTIVPSTTLYDIALQVWKLPSDRVIHMPNGIDCARFAGQYDRELVHRLGIDQNDLVVGTVAALRREKNLARLLRIFSRLPSSLPAKLVIVGDGPEREQLERTARELGMRDRVIMAGALAQPERLLKRFDVFALSSDTEQMPNSILEAMAAGRAIISTDVGDVKEMVAAENRPFVRPSGAEQALVDALITLMTNRELRERIGDCNTAQVNSTYSLGTMVNRYEAIFRDFTQS